MKKRKVYLDTSVVGGYYDTEFEEDSKKLFQLFDQGVYIAVVSDTTLTELKNAPQRVQDLILKVPDSSIIRVEITKEMTELADLYVSEGIITPKYYDDALHIATACIAGIDVLVSWNFKHIVNLDKIHKFNSVNLREGYQVLEIRTPKEVL